jgi:hypothetical protein
VYRLFDQWASGPTLDAVTKANAGDFPRRVAKLDPTWGRSPETKQRTFAQIMEQYGKGNRGLTNRTINRYAMALGLVWRWADRRGLYEGRNVGPRKVDAAARSATRRSCPSRSTN